MRMTIALAALLATAGFAGIASADTNPCTYGSPVPGSAFAVCALNETSTSYAYCNTINWGWAYRSDCQSYSETSNSPARASASQNTYPTSTGANAGATQSSSSYDRTYQECDQWGCYYNFGNGYDREATSVGGNAAHYNNLAFARLGASFYQEDVDSYSYDSWGYYTYAYRSTSVRVSEDLYAPVLGYQYVGAGYVQTASGSSCTEYTYLQTHTLGSSYSAYVTPPAACAQEIPQLTSFCQPVDSLTVCTKFPSWPALGVPSL